MSSPLAPDPFMEEQNLSQKPQSGVLLMSHWPEHMVCHMVTLTARVIIFQSSIIFKQEEEMIQLLVIQVTVPIKDISCH